MPRVVDLDPCLGLEATSNCSAKWWRHLGTSGSISATSLAPRRIDRPAPASRKLAADHQNGLRFCRNERCEWPRCVSRMSAFARGLDLPACEVQHAFERRETATDAFHPSPM